MFPLSFLLNYNINMSIKPQYQYLYCAILLLITTQLYALYYWSVIYSFMPHQLIKNNTLLYPIYLDQYCYVLNQIRHIPEVAGTSRTVTKHNTYKLTAPLAYVVTYLICALAQLVASLPSKRGVAASITGGDKYLCDEQKCLFSGVGCCYALLYVCMPPATQRVPAFGQQYNVKLLLLVHYLHFKVLYLHSRVPRKSQTTCYYYKYLSFNNTKCLVIFFKLYLLFCLQTSSPNFYIIYEAVKRRPPQHCCGWIVHYGF